LNRRVAILDDKFPVQDIVFSLNEIICVKITCWWRMTFDIRYELSLSSVDVKQRLTLQFISSSIIYSSFHLGLIRASRDLAGKEDRGWGAPCCRTKAKVGKGYKIDEGGVFAQSRSERKRRGPGVAPFAVLRIKV
jgi:hypothetical protein